MFCQLPRSGLLEPGACTLTGFARWFYVLVAFVNFLSRFLNLQNLSNRQVMRKSLCEGRELGMFEVDRSIVVVRPTQAFYDLYKSLPDSPKKTYATVREEAHSYMLPKIETKESPSTVIPDGLAHTIFEWELMLREIDDQHWPKNRTKVDDLLEWFEIQVVPLVVDTLDDELNKHLL